MRKETVICQFAMNYVDVCLRQEFSDWKGKLGPAHSVRVTTSRAAYSS